jgi:hypothetical protein
MQAIRSTYRRNRRIRHSRQPHVCGPTYCMTGTPCRLASLAKWMFMSGESTPTWTSGRVVAM